MPLRFSPPEPDEPPRTPPRPPLNDTRLPAPLRAVQGGLAINARSVMSALASGEIDVSEWQAEIETLLAAYHAAAFIAGGGTLTDAGQAAVAGLLRSQFQFLEGFKLSIQDADAFERGWNARLDQYAKSVTMSYRNGEVAERAGGRILALPAMPAEGTICGTNCGCRWDINELQEGDYNCYWRLGKNDNCATCLARTAAWNPLRIRGGSLQV